MATKLAITERALLQRLNRKLKPQNLVVKKPRGRAANPARLGDYFVLDSQRNFIVDQQLTLGDVEKLARKHQALQGWETVEK